MPDDKLRTFDGETYIPELDEKRLNTQYGKVWTLMKDGQWRTLHEISDIINAPTQSISARLTDFRKPRNGAHTVNVRHRGEKEKGLYEYQLIINTNPVKVVKIKSKNQIIKELKDELEFYKNLTCIHSVPVHLCGQGQGKITHTGFMLKKYLRSEVDILIRPTKEI